MGILKALGMGLAIIILQQVMSGAFSAFSNMLLAMFQFMEHAIHVGDAML